jgi:peptidoglycan hydrolase-like protein with peptidoglycan-binding domain
MGIVTARLVFLAFLGLTGTIIYNALYLQEHDMPAGLTTASPSRPAANESPTAVSGRSQIPPPVSTDLPPLDAGAGESQRIVRAVQRELAARGYDVGQVDGSLSDKTRAAISAFQSKQGLTVTGVPSDDLLRQILLGDSVGQASATGSVAADNEAAKGGGDATVRTVQRILADLGYAPGPIDGAWGTDTSHAITAFQRDRNIAQTGRITRELLNELKRVTGRDLTKTAAKP